MGIEIRPITDAEIASYKRVSTIAFANAPVELDEVTSDPSFELDRTRCAFDGQRLIAVSRAISFDVTVPGGSVRASGIADVGVLPTHRRRGVLTALMAELFDDARGRGEPVALLTASEGGIYGRFGFGVAAHRAELELTKAGAVVLGSDDGGSVELVAAPEASETLAPLFDASRVQFAGDVNRPMWWWEAHLTPKKGERLPFVAVRRDANGRTDGYALYDLRSEDGRRVARLHDLVALSPSAHTGLWRYLVGIDLVAAIIADHAAVDAPVRFLLGDPRQVRVTRVVDMLWARLLDVGAALAARTYGADDEIAIRVVDADVPSNEGTWVLGSTGGVTTCERDDRAPAALGLDVAALGAAWLGDTSFAALATAGRVDEHAAGVVIRADRLFSSRPAPHCRTHF
jgi:predicted acetyltransferase